MDLMLLGKLILVCRSSFWVCSIVLLVIRLRDAVYLLKSYCGT